MMTAAGAGENPPGVLDIVPVNGTRAAARGATIDWYADPEQISLKVTSRVPASKASLNKDRLAGGDGIEIYARPLDQSPRIDPHMQVSVLQQTGDGWKETPQLKAQTQTGNVPMALWGAKDRKGELTSGLTDVHLYAVPERPNQTVAVPVEGLLFSAATAIPSRWERPSVPALTPFDWATRNPFDTVRSEAAAGRRSGMLADLVSRGLLKADTAAAIDLRNVLAQEPCFMAQPLLTTLGAEKKAA
jgi:hypothetical protein